MSHRINQRLLDSNNRLQGPTAPVASQFPASQTSLPAPELSQAESCLRLTYDIVQRALASSAGFVKLVVLRATRKVLKRLPSQADEQVASDNALGDWYVNRVVVDRRPLLLFVSSRSLLAMIAPARDLRRLPERLADMVAARLRRLGIDEQFIEPELSAMASVAIGRTRDRSVTGTMVEFAKELPYFLPSDGWDDTDLLYAEGQFSERPCLCGRTARETIWPRERTVQLLVEQWQSVRSLH